jgi:armadillo repeat-containing protein 8
MLAILSSPDCSSSLVLSILTALDAIADRLPLQSQDSPRDNQLAELLCSKEHVGCLARVISQTSTSQMVQFSITLAAGLVAKLGTEESQKATLADAGVLDALASKVASFVVSQGFVLPGAEQNLYEPGVLPAIPLPAPPNAQLAPILRATAVVIEYSKWRGEHFLSSPWITSVFPKQLPEFSPSDIKKAPWGSTYLSGSAVPRLSATSPIDQILPALPLSRARVSTNFPPLAPHGLYGKHGHGPLSSYLEMAPSEEDESPLVPWLLCVVRAEMGMTRLMAARLVTVLFQLGFAKRHRIAMFGYILIPMLLRTLDKDCDPTAESDPESDSLIPVVLRIREEAPAILASLVMDTQELQKHAVDGGAITKLSQLLKETYNPFQENTKAMWHPEDVRPGFRSPGQPELRLGPPGYSPMVNHIMRYREGILRALAAVATFKDEYRKAICEHGVVPYIIDSLKPRPSEQPEVIARSKNTVADGNPIPTLLAACGAARSLTRSVSVLRTSLIDAGVTKPLFELIKHPDVEVQIAATSVICNLALDFSPMKEVFPSLFLLSHLSF